MPKNSSWNFLLWDKNEKIIDSDELIFLLKQEIDTLFQNETNFLINEENEHKVLDIVKDVPYFGNLYRAARAIVYTIKHDKVEVDYSITRDMSNINPVRILANFIRSCINANHSYDEGIWVGKRSLKRCLTTFYCFNWSCSI